MLTLRSLVTHFDRPGRVEEILLRPARGQRAVSVGRVEARVGLGLVGDRSAAVRQADAKRRRQVTMIQAEHLAVVAALLQRPAIDAAELRRNLVVSGLNLIAVRSPLRDRPLHLAFGSDPASPGCAMFEVTGACDPCSAMETALGFGGFNAMRGHGGVTARVLRDGVIETGMPVWVIAAPEGAATAA